MESWRNARNLLEGYLERKRASSSILLYVRNPMLLIILSQGSDPMQMQPYYEKVFDSIDKVVHNKADKTQIIQIQSSIGNAKGDCGFRQIC